jgi:hypothetical protein
MLIDLVASQISIAKRNRCSSLRLQGLRGNGQTCRVSGQRARPFGIASADAEACGRRMIVQVAVSPVVGSSFIAPQCRGLGDIAQYFCVTSDTEVTVRFDVGEGKTTFGASLISSSLAPRLSVMNHRHPAFRSGSACMGRARIPRPDMVTSILGKPRGRPFVWRSRARTLTAPVSNANACLGFHGGVAPPCCNHRSRWTFRCLAFFGFFPYQRFGKPRA